MNQHSHWDIPRKTWEIGSKRISEKLKTSQNGWDIQEAQWIPRKINSDTHWGNCSQSFVSQRESTASTKQLVIYKQFSIRLSDFSSETWEARKQRLNTFKCKTNQRKVSSKNPISGKTVLQESEEEIKTSQHTKAEGVCYHWICSVRNSSGRLPGET